jgi:hypothetical protein
MHTHLAGGEIIAEAVVLSRRAVCGRHGRHQRDYCHRRAEDHRDCEMEARVITPWWGVNEILTVVTKKDSEPRLDKHSITSHSEWGAGKLMG